MRILAVGLLLLAAGGCSESLDDQYAKVERFAENNQTGQSPDAWLVKNGLAGPERVALIFGFVPDSEFCIEVADMYNKKYPDGGRYTCELAN